MDLVSIITPVFNSEKTILETIQSVQAQTHSNFEHLVVIDVGTMDQTGPLVLESAAKDPRIKLLKLEKVRGVSHARNLALDQAQGKFICFLDADDLWLPSKLQDQIQYMKQRNIFWSCHQWRRINYDGSKMGRLIDVPEQQKYFDVLKNNRVPCLSVMFNLHQKPLVARFEQRHQEDFIFWLDLLKQGEICFGLKKDLARYRVVQNSRSLQAPRLQSRWQIYRQREGLSILNSAWNYFHYLATALTKRLSF